MQKRQSSHQCPFVIMGPTRIKAARKMLVKLPPGVVVNAEDSQSEPWSSDVGSNPSFT